MNSVNEPYRCAIIGTGPRGLFALEQILAKFAVSTQVALHVDIFESSDYPDCGPNYAPDNSLSNQLYIPLRDVPLNAKAAVDGIIRVASFDSFNDWYQSRNTEDDKDVDHFPPRACKDLYLQDRFKNLLADPSVDKCLTLHSERVVALIPQSAGWKVETEVSSDGQPMTPKPVNKLIDSRFRPSDDLLLAAEQILTFDFCLPAGKNELRNLLVDIVCDSIVDIFRRFDTVQHKASSPEYLPGSSEDILHVTRQWLLDEAFEHPLIVNSQMPTVQLMQRFLDRALGRCPPSLDYCIGQIWKHLQPIYYQQLSFHSFDSDAIESTMSLDQRLKRYAFGPPVEAIAGLLALSNADLLHFRIADDPDITLRTDGWTFCQGDDAIKAHCLINTVLSQANVTAMNSDLVSSVKHGGLLPLAHDSLGVRATKDRLLHNTESALCATGRLIIGSVLEAGALLCCFGDGMPRWASGVAQRALRH